MVPSRVAFCSRVKGRSKRSESQVDSAPSAVVFCSFAGGGSIQLWTFDQFDFSLLEALRLSEQIDPFTPLTSSLPPRPLSFFSSSRSHLSLFSAMSIRRPPTAITLKPSDVSDMTELIAQRNAAAAAAATSDAQGAGAAGAREKGRDATVERERKMREEREARSRGDRVGA